MATTNGAKRCPICGQDLYYELTVQYSVNAGVELAVGDLLRQMPPIGSTRWACGNCRFFCYFLPEQQPTRRGR